MDANQNSSVLQCVKEKKKCFKSRSLMPSLHFLIDAVLYFCQFNNVPVNLSGIDIYYLWFIHTITAMTCISA